MRSRDLDSLLRRSTTKSSRSFLAIAFLGFAISCSLFQDALNAQQVQSSTHEDCNPSASLHEVDSESLQCIENCGDQDSKCKEQCIQDQERLGTRLLNKQVTCNNRVSDEGRKREADHLAELEAARLVKQAADHPDDVTLAQKDALKRAGKLNSKVKTDNPIVDSFREKTFHDAVTATAQIQSKAMKDLAKEIGNFGNENATSRISTLPNASSAADSSTLSIDAKAMQNDFREGNQQYDSKKAYVEAIKRDIDQNPHKERDALRNAIATEQEEQRAWAEKWKRIQVEADVYARSRDGSAPSSTSASSTAASSTSTSTSSSDGYCGSDCMNKIIRGPNGDYRNVPKATPISQSNADSSCEPSSNGASCAIH